jgi:hypothetical protein
MNNYKNILIFLAIALVAICAYSYSAQVLAYTNPVANAGPDQNIESCKNCANLTTTLHGSGYDPEGKGVTFHWYCSGGFLSNPNIAEPVLTMPVNSAIFSSTSYNCTLNVTGTTGGFASDNVLININGNNTNNYIVTTSPATNISNTQATLHGNVDSSNNTYNYGTTYVWFQWGTSLSYGYETIHKAVINGGNFDQNIADLIPNTTYHFRAVSQLSTGQLYYGQDASFISNTSAITTALATTGGIQGTPTSISTGLTNNFLTDSFFLPLLIALIGTWMWMSGMFVGVEEWLTKRKIKHKNIQAERKLYTKIEEIKKEGK